MAASWGELPVEDVAPWPSTRATTNRPSAVRGARRRGAAAARAAGPMDAPASLGPTGREPAPARRAPAEGHHGLHRGGAGAGGPADARAGPGPVRRLDAVGRGRGAGAGLQGVLQPPSFQGRGARHGWRRRCCTGSASARRGPRWPRCSGVARRARTRSSTSRWTCPRARSRARSSTSATTTRPRATSRSSVRWRATTSRESSPGSAGGGRRRRGPLWRQGAGHVLQLHGPVRRAAQGRDGLLSRVAPCAR